MGTLRNQPPRDHFHQDLDSLLTELGAIGNKHNINIATAIEAKKALEFERQNNITVQNGDYHDEQMAGLGDILERISGAIESVGQ